MIFEPVPMFEGLFPENQIIAKGKNVRTNSRGNVFLEFELGIEPVFERIIFAANRFVESYWIEDEEP
jgi:hypothetical protein